MIAVCPMCEPFKRGDHEHVHYRVCVPHERQLEKNPLVEPVKRDVYMVLVNEFSGCVFVKDLAFFRGQGGFREKWGETWVPIVATSIEDAREKGCSLPGAKPYDKQAK